MLIPLILHTIWSVTSTKQSLTNAASQALSIAAKKSGKDLELLLNNTLRDIEISSQLHELTDYLYLSGEQRATSSTTNKISTIFRILYRNAQPYAVSYALLDTQGIAVMDTNSYNIGSDESQQNFYKEVLRTGKPYISHVMFHKMYPQKASVYFSAPVLNTTGEVAGVLRARFSAAFVQDFIHDLDGLAGDDSFAMLLNNDNLVLGHSGIPSLIYNMFASLDAERASQLQQDGRLPNFPLDKLVIEADTLTNISSGSLETEIMTTRLVPGTDQIYQAAMSNLVSVPWRIILAQPKDVFLRPIAQQIDRTLLFVGITILFVIIFGVFISHQLAKPIVHLTSMARKIADGDLSSQMPIISKDERGQLATAFNSMAVQLRDLIGGLRDEIAERELAEQALRKSDDRFRSLFMDSPTSLWEADFSQIKIYIDELQDSVVTDFEYYFNNHPKAIKDCAKLLKVTNVNTATLKLFGARDKEQILNGFPIGRNDQFLETFKEELIALAQGKSRYTSESMLRTLDGEERNVVVHLNVAPGYKESLAKVLVSLIDVTESKRVEQEMHSLKERLFHAQKMESIGTLAGGIAHDFNNMIGGIMGATELLGMKIPDEPKVQKYHRMILETAQRAADLTGQLLAFSRNNPQESIPINIHDIVNETATLLKNTIDKRIELQISLKADRSIILGDSSGLQNIILNICINGSHAMPDGGTISIDSRVIALDSPYCNASTFDLQPGEYLELEIRDTGKGIPANLLDKIFDPFFTTKEQGKGTGLGLASTYGLIKQHKGSVSVYSELGTGTAFHIVLPLAQAGSVVEKVVPVLKKGSGTILVVDDEEILRETAKVLLEDLGYKVILATNGQEAVTLFKQNLEDIDLVLLDMIMPVMNGRECFTELKKLDREVKVVVASGFTREDDLQKIKLLGLKGFMRKPYSSNALSQVIDEALR